MEEIREFVAKMSLEEKIGQMIGVSFAGTGYSKELQSFIEEIGVGLVIYFKSNVENPKQVFELNQKMVQNAKIPPFIALDQEGGMVMRVTDGIVTSPGAMAISATGNLEYAYQLAYNMGRDLRNIGFNVNFAPVGDVNNNPNNPVINVRSYSDRPEVVAEFVEHVAKGYDDARILTTVKHFPGHGDTNVDSHLGLPVVESDKNRLYQVEFKPFLHANRLKLPGMMTSHIVFNAYDKDFPATLSERLINGLLRTAFGYEGLVVTDSLTMAAIFNHYTIDEIAYYGFNAGCDILLMCGPYQISKQFYQSALRLAKEGKIPQEVIDRAVTRILKYKLEYEVGQMANQFEDIEWQLKELASVALSEKVSLESITVVQDPNHLIPLSEEEKVLFVVPKLQVVTLVENPKTEQLLYQVLPHNFSYFSISLSPSEEEKNRLLFKANNFDKIVYCSYNANLNKEQSDLINQFDPKDCIVVSLRSPYDIKCLTKKFTYLCTYEATPLSLNSLIQILSGKEKAVGKCPVTLTL